MTRTITLVRHQVADFDAWKKENRQRRSRCRRAWGTRPSGAALRHDPNEVIVTHTFDSSEAAHKFMAAPEINAAMKRAGITRLAEDIVLRRGRVRETPGQLVTFAGLRNDIEHSAARHHD